MVPLTAGGIDQSSGQLKKLEFMGRGELCVVVPSEYVAERHGWQE